VHEFSIAASIVESVLAFAAAQEAAKVLCVRITLGELTHIEAEQLSFCYESITKETPLDGSTLEIETAAARVRCLSCSYAGPPKYWDGALGFAAVPTLQCPDCGKTTEILEGEECAIKTVKFTR
jgi:hydrogenase nickel incorporation protein HypA/HybF